ncbi:glycosyltransferase family 2 protein [Candidatus Woesearchaeota archaeon]|nr:glycosyltransferase family 2 protein [Candidatus Woesearchaeota archaeon]
MKKAASITLIVPAYNEERNLGNSITTINDTVKRFVADYELIVIDDGSRDSSGAIAEDFAKRNPRIRVVHFKTNRGPGAVYREAIRLATKEYIMLLTGDNGIPAESIARMLGRIGDADILNSYTMNPEVRPIVRRLVSTLYTTMLNLLFGLNVKYYNGLALYKLSLARQVKITTSSFAFHAEVLLQLLKSKQKHSYLEVPVLIQEEEGSATNIFRVKNIIGVCIAIPKMFFRAYFGS